MSKVFVVTNQHGHFLDKHREWVDGREPRLLFRSPHKDEAINLVFEVSAKDIYMRAEALQTDLNDKGQPIVEVTTEIPTAAEIEAAEAADSEPEPVAEPPEEESTLATH